MSIYNGMHVEMPLAPGGYLMMLKEKLQELARMIERSIALDEDMQPVIRDKASIRNEITIAPCFL
jgi:hypothetical protein